MMAKYNWLIFIVFYLIPTFAFGQVSATTEWEHTFGLEKNDGAHSIIPTKDNGFAVLGYCTDASFNVDLWLVKLDAQGKEKWNKKYGTSQALEKGIDLLQLQNGDYILLGHCNSMRGGAIDIWLMRLDSKGSLLEEKKLTKGSDDFASELIACQKGGYAIAATTNSTETDNSSMWLIKLNNELELEWDRRFGGDEFPTQNYQTVGGETRPQISREEAYTLTQTADNGFALGGYLSDPKKMTNAWVIKTDSMGQESWNQSYGTVGGDFVNGIYESNQKIVAVGIRYDKKDNYNYMMDFAIVDKEKVLEKTFNADDYETVEASCQTKDGGFLLIGFKGELPSKARRENRDPNLDIWMLKVSAEGEKQWEHTITPKASFQLKDIIETEENTFLMAGAKRDTSTQLQDMWVMKVKVVD